MKKTIGVTLTALFFMASLGSAFADEKIAARKENRQDGIAQGVKSGSLTAGETAHLEKRETNLDKEIRTDPRANGGNLTNNEKAHVNRQQNRISRNIYNDKHNAPKK